MRRLILFGEHSEPIQESSEVRKVLDCASPLAFLKVRQAADQFQSARGLAQSKTLARPAPSASNDRNQMPQLRLDLLLAGDGLRHLLAEQVTIAPT